MKHFFPGNKFVISVYCFLNELCHFDFLKLISDC